MRVGRIQGFLRIVRSLILSKDVAGRMGDG